MRILLIYLEALRNEPIGLMYIGTVLKRAGHTVKIIGMPKQYSDKKLLRELTQFKPDVAGISVTTPLANKAQHVAKRIKNSFPKTTVIAGGPHPTVLPYATLRDKNIDICVLGEGEDTTIDLVETLNSQSSLRNVNGIAFLKDDKLVITGKRACIENLDSLPFVDREFIPRKIIYGRAGYPLGNPCMLLITVRGCPYSCSFCQPTVEKLFGKRIRRRSPENVLKEISELKEKYSINGLWINDDTFLYDHKWAEKFCDLMIQKKLNISWYTNGRINKVDKNILTKMRNAGCIGIVLTPETGSSRIRNDILNKKISDEEIINAYSICHEVGIPMQANIMIGSPTETKKDLELSLGLIKRIQPHFMNLSYTTALPETHLAKRYSEEITSSAYYKSYENYDIADFKKVRCGISDLYMKNTWKFFIEKYGNTSFSNRARHFFKYKYFRKILYKRWKTLLLSKHPNLKHFLFDIVAISLGSIAYLRNIKAYKKTD